MGRNGNVKTATFTPAMDQLIGQYIERHPYRSSVADAWLPRYGYSVWILIDALEAEGGDLQHVADGYNIPVDAMQAALAYYFRHKEAIDTRMKANTLEFDSAS